jgi:outer membrane protein assembly factor BamB
VSFSTALLLVLLAVVGETEQWPRFRGPDSVPVSANPDLPDRWSTTDNVEWAVDVPGVGWSSPIVWGEKVFLTSATADRPMKSPSLGTDFSNEYLAELRAEGLSPEEVNARLYARDREMPDEIVIGLNLYCYDLATGKLWWERQVYHGSPPGGRHRKNSFASETPVTDGERVYAYFTQVGLYAYDFEGNAIWNVPLPPHPTIRDYGTGASPALHRDRIFVLNDNESEAFVAAFEARSGRELWRTPRRFDQQRKTGWSTPFVWENEIGAELVTLGPGAVVSYDLEGRELWRLSGMAGMPIQSPFAWNGLLYVTSGSSGEGGRTLAVIRAARGGEEKGRIVWEDRLAGATYLPTPLVYEGALYVLSAKGIVARYDARTGERMYRARVSPEAAAFTASPWAYDGKVFALSEEGDTFVIEAGATYRLLGVNRLEDWAMPTPAIAGDRLLVRTGSKLYSIRKRSGS